MLGQPEVENSGGEYFSLSGNWRLVTRSASCPRTFMLIPGMQGTVECSDAARRVNTPSQIKHWRMSRLRAMNTLPILSVRVKPAPR